MLRTSLISVAILAAPPAPAAGLVASYVVERGDAPRVKDASGAAGGDAAAVEVVFGMGRSASQGFVAAAGHAEGGAMVSRGPRTAGGLCPEQAVRLP